MTRKTFGAGTLLGPLPVVMVTAGDAEKESNIITIAWTGIVNTKPPMTYISVRPERYSYRMIDESGEFVINLVDRKMAEAADYCGVKSGKETDKWKETGLHKEVSEKVKCPQIAESPLSLECRVRDKIELGSHHMFLAEILCVRAREDIVDENNRLCIAESGLVSYAHGGYFGLEEESVGRFGFSVMKQKTKKRIEKEKRKRSRDISRMKTRKKRRYK